ncbi:acrosin-like isoform X2 [Passer domesticus]
MTRVVGGKSAESGAWPWLVSIQDPSVSGTGHLCGGSLISTQWVLTAAHCFTESRNLSDMRVLIGATKLTKPGPGAEVRLIKRLLIHKDYSPADQSNDIALLELNQPVQCSSYIQLVCVPNATLNVAQLENCYVAGWGATTARSQQSSDVLQEAKVHLINVEVCNSSEWYQGDVHTHNLCAGYPEGGIDTCQGDSGGPLMCRDNSADFFWVVGVTSWGRGCARAKRPGIYTSVQHFYDWILVQMDLLPQVEASRSWSIYPTASQPWTHHTNAPWPTQKPWPRPPPTYKPWPTTTLPPPKPWPTTLPPTKPWPTTLPAPKPWPPTLPPTKPWPTTAPAPKPWPPTLPPTKPWPTTAPAPKPWPPTLPPTKPWPTTAPAPKPWPPTLPPTKPWPTTAPAPKPWPPTLPPTKPWPTTAPAPKPWPPTLPPTKPWPTTAPAPKPWPTTLPPPKPSVIPAPVEEIKTCPFPLKKLMEFFTKIRELLKNLQGIAV